MPMRWAHLVFGLVLVACPAESDPEAQATEGVDGSSGGSGSSVGSSPTSSASASDDSVGPVSSADSSVTITDGTGESTSATTEPETTTGGPVGSAGCGMADPASGDLVIDVDGMQGQYVLSLPAGYDPNTPLPLGFAFHGAGRTGPNCQDGDCAGFQSAMEDEAVLVYMTSLGGPGWTDDIDLEVGFFETVLDHVLANYCIDESLVYTAGTSSGAHFVNILGCRLADRIAAIAPVAGVLFSTDCGGQVAALVIHGVDDGSFDGGVEARDFWAAHNGCSDTTVPPIEDVHSAVVGEPESHGCAEYEDCDAGAPVVWCEHSEGGYDGSTHGWPLFGGDRIWEFVQAL
jgi:poly(3-hydroxybutyrate) depolymerase